MKDVKGRKVREQGSSTNVFKLSKTFFYLIFKNGFTFKGRKGRIREALLSC